MPDAPSLSGRLCRQSRWMRPDYALVTFPSPGCGTVGGNGGTITGLEAATFPSPGCGTVGGNGGTITGLEAATFPSPGCGTVGGSGGTITGLEAATFPSPGCGTVGGNGGTITGLVSANRPPPGCGTVGGSGGTITGLAAAVTAPVTRAAVSTASWSLNLFFVMELNLLRVLLCIKRVTQKLCNIYNKSNHSVNYRTRFCFEWAQSLPLLWDCLGLACGIHGWGS